MLLPVPLMWRSWYCCCCAPFNVLGTRSRPSFCVFRVDCELDARISACLNASPSDLCLLKWGCAAASAAVENHQPASSQSNRSAVRLTPSGSADKLVLGGNAPCGDAEASTVGASCQLKWIGGIQNISFLLNVEPLLVVRYRYRKFTVLQFLKKEMGHLQVVLERTIPRHTWVLSSPWKKSLLNKTHTKNKRAHRINTSDSQINTHLFLSNHFYFFISNKLQLIFRNFNSILQTFKLD